MTQGDGTTRRSVTTGLLASALLPGALAAPAMAQTFPSQDFRFITGFPPGSGADIMTRFVAEKWRQVSKRNVIVENKVGAAGNLAVEAAARSTPDGHTMLLLTGSSTAALMHLFKKPPVDVMKQLKIAATLSRQAFMLVVDPKSPYKTVAELTEAMKKKGTAANYGSSSPSGIVMGEVYKSLTGVQAVEVRFRTGADTLNEMAAGKLDYSMLDPQVSLAQAAQGRLRILAHCAGTRLEAVPDIPTMAESGVKGMDLTGWWAMIVPAGVPDPVVAQINAWAKEMLADPEVKKFFAATGGDVFVNSVADGQALYVREEKAWGEYVRLSKIEPQ